MAVITEIRKLQKLIKEKTLVNIQNGSRAGVRAASRAGTGVTHGAGPGGSLSASASSPSPSSAAAAASGCSLGPRGAARALGPSVVFRLLLLPATGSRGGGCAGGRRPRGSRGGRRTAALTRSACGCGCYCRTRRRLRLRRLLEDQSLPGRAAPRSRPEPGFDVRTAQPPRARRRAVPQRPLRPRARPSGRADSEHRSPRLGPSRRGRREKAAGEDRGSFTCRLKVNFACRSSREDLPPVVAGASPLTVQLRQHPCALRLCSAPPRRHPVGNHPFNSSDMSELREGHGAPDTLGPGGVVERGQKEISLTCSWAEPGVDTPRYAFKGKRK
uniref:serine/arginine repetitive matrix protein 3-like n=1 Tax=Halichoerus grypus TaxID=9711 RepID=UPI001659CDA4|nr:serine/arginine repetitive matrix protein 3-like [Halichoerus grypus]